MQTKLWWRYVQTSTVLSHRRHIILSLVVALIGILSGASLINSAASSTMLTSNWWDVIFASLSNRFFVLVAFGSPFAYLISDIAIENHYTQILTMKLGNRTTWWLGKCLVTGFTALVYTALVTGGVMAAATAWGVSANWSQLAKTALPTLGISPLMLTLTPVSAFTLTVMLMCLGLWTIGLVVQCVARIFGRPFIGFLGAFVVIWSSIAVDNFVLVDRLPNVFVRPHWVFASQLEINGVLFSVGYWLVSIIGFALIGWWVAYRVDFL